MKCPKCQTNNPQDSKFCKECAAPLTRLETPQISVTRTMETSAVELIRGTVFAGRYEIIEELGTGGMGRVYRVHDTKLNEEVALKLIKPEIAAERRVVERFQNEIKIARKIRHKNVCGMYDFHEERRTLFLTMEYVRGEDLRSVIHRMKVLSVGTAVSIARQVAEGLGEAHKLGIIHRDLKPGNIMIDKDGQAKIMDFGIARAKQEKGVTGEGAIIGTPEYMSPEQVEGKEADQRSDIYALGVILFEMLTGRTPFEGDTSFAIANKHKTEPPPIPKKLVPQIPEALNKLILQCLEKDRAKRYQTPEELVADLAAVEQAQPTTDRALTRAKTKIRTSREITVKLTPRKVLVSAAAVIILAIATVMMLTLIKSRPGKIDSLAVLPLSDLSKDPAESSYVDGIHDALINQLTKVRAIRVIGRQNVLRYKDAKKTYSEIARELNVAAVIEGSVFREGNRIRITVKLIDGRTEKQIWGPNEFDRDLTDILSLYSEVALTIAREINTQLSSQDIGNLTRSRKVNPEAYKLYLQARSLTEPSPNAPIVADPASKFKKMLELFQRSVEIDPNFALGHAGLAGVYSSMGTNGYLSTDEAYRKAKDAAIKSLSLDDSLVEAHVVLGRNKFMYEWDFAGAEKEYQRAMELGQEGFRGSIVEYLTLVGRFEEALAIQKRAIESNPLYPDYANLFWILYEAKRFDDAIAAANKAIELNLDVWYVRGLRSNCYAIKKMCAEAIAETEKILSENPAAKSDMDTLSSMAYNYAVCGNRKKAEELIKILKRFPHLDPSYLSAVYLGLGEKDLAMAGLEKALERRSPGMLWLKVDPMFDPLRDDPRFIALLKKVGFEK